MSFMQLAMTSEPYHGLLVLDKPGGMTSRDAVDRALGWFPRRTRMGHCGTLDPLATGVLVLCVGSATRLIEYVQDMAKTYHAGLLLGARSTTDDADGSVTPVPVEQPPDRETVQRHVQAFVGTIEQTPPAYSAAKLSGRRAYELARQGKDVPLQPRPVEIHRIEVLAYAFPRLHLAVECGKGTYMRSLARDLGDRLGCGALVETLRRTRIGPFVVTDAVSLETDGTNARSRLLPLSAAVASMPRLTLDAVQAIKVRQGQSLPVPTSSWPLLANQPMPQVALFDGAGTFIGVAVFDPGKYLLRPEKILGPP
jgi:tRNA pseudouridine55 synthase